MLKQLRLFEADATSRSDPPPKPPPASAPHNGRETSQAAADAIRPVVSKTAQRVYAFIQSCGNEGATDLEVQTALGIAGDTERPPPPSIGASRVHTGFRFETRNPVRLFRGGLDCDR